jgi:hypothetical protein
MADGIFIGTLSPWNFVSGQCSAKRFAPGIVAYDARESRDFALNSLTSNDEVSHDTDHMAPIKRLAAAFGLTTPPLPLTACGADLLSAPGILSYNGWMRLPQGFRGAVRICRPPYRACARGRDLRHGANA